MSDPSPTGLPGFARTYGVELLYSQVPTIDEALFRAAIERQLPDSEVTPVSGAGFLVAHKRDVITFVDGSKASTTVLMIGKPGVEPAKFSEALDQTWTWRDEAARRLAECTHSALVTDIASVQIPAGGPPSPAPSRRIELVLSVVRAACEASAVRVIAWHPAGKLQDTDQLEDLVEVAINARMFRDTGGTSRLIMDTLGLAAVGLPDVQLDFHGLEPGRVASWLIGVARYILDHGDAIADNHTVAGIPADSKWRCRHEMAIAGPERVVLDVDPGAEFSNRKRT